MYRYTHIYTGATLSTACTSGRDRPDSHCQVQTRRLPENTLLRDCGRATYLLQAPPPRTRHRPCWIPVSVHIYMYIYIYIHVYM